METSLEKRFWKYTEITDNCWIWKGVKNHRGYGYLIYWPTRFHHSTHRISWELHNGKIPEGLLVLHHCDNPACVNPKHLWIGTQLDNMRDKVNKGRQAKGEKSGVSRFTENQIKEIRNLYKPNVVSLRYLARKYCTSMSQIQRIVKRKIWRHI